MRALTHIFSLKGENAVATAHPMQAYREAIEQLEAFARRHSTDAAACTGALKQLRVALPWSILLHEASTPEKLVCLADKVAKHLSSHGAALFPAGLKNGDLRHAIAVHVQRQADGRYGLAIYNTGWGIAVHPELQPGRFARRLLVHDIAENTMTDAAVVSRLMFAEGVDAPQTLYAAAKCLGTHIWDEADPQRPQITETCTWKVLGSYLRTTLGRPKYLLFKRHVREAMWPSGRLLLAAANELHHARAKLYRSRSKAAAAR